VRTFDDPSERFIQSSDTDVPDSLLDQVNSFQTAVSYCFLRCCEAQLLINDQFSDSVWQREESPVRTFDDPSERFIQSSFGEFHC
jgi:hypothetical protein